MSLAVFRVTHFSFHINSMDSNKTVKHAVAYQMSKRERIVLIVHSLNKLQEV